MSTALCSSTMSILATPSPAERRTLISTTSGSGLNRPSRPTQSGSAYATPARPSAAPSSSSSATKIVRFSPAQPLSSTPGGSKQTSLDLFANTPASAAAAAPPSRMYSFTPPATTTAASTTPSSLIQSTSLPALASSLSKKKSHNMLGGIAPPLGRGAVARRLRINAVLLVAWWLSGRTHVYGFASGHLVQVFPSLDAPLHILESSVLLLLFYNILESMWSLQNASSLSSTPRLNGGPTASTSSPRLPPKQSSANSPFSTPIKWGSYKTRPSPAISPSPSLSRRTPISAPASPFRVQRSTSSPQASSPLPRASDVLKRSGWVAAPLTPSPSKDITEESVLIKAYLAKHSHSPSLASSVRTSIDSREGIDRLLE